jgi:CelD/BcsL family acetyltransferase involved in cellulose biosynthesis
MAAFVAFEHADLGTVVLDRIGRASCQMRIAAAFDAAKRPNESLLLDDEGTRLHSPAPDPSTVELMQSDKRYGIGTILQRSVKNCAKRVIETKRARRRNSDRAASKPDESNA